MCAVTITCFIVTEYIYHVDSFLAFIHCDHRNGFTPINKALVSVVSGDLLFHRQVELQQKFPVVNHYTVNTFAKLPVMILNDKHPVLHRHSLFLRNVMFIP